MWITPFHSWEGWEVEGDRVNVYEFCGWTAMKKEAGKGSGWTGRTKQLYLHGHNDFGYYVQLLSVKFVSFSS